MVLGKIHPSSTVGDISLDPQFVSATDFNLTSSSPCIDSGDPDLDGDGNNYTSDIDDQDPDGTRLDMGYVYYSQGPIVNPIDSIDVPDIMCGSKLWSTGESTSSITVYPNRNNHLLRKCRFYKPSCTITDSVTVYVNSITEVEFEIDTLNYCGVDSVLLDAGPGYDIYGWSPGQFTTGETCLPFTFTGGINAQSIYAQESGTYYVQVTDSLNCSSMDSIVVSLLTPTFVGPTSIFEDDTVGLVASIDGVGFLLESYDTVFVNPSQSIQLALDTAESGTVIMLESGTYTENIVWPQTDHLILK